MAEFLAECGSCMAFDRDKEKTVLGGLITYGWCKRFQCWRRSGHAACEAFVKDHACFLTTACVKYKGLADDCKELTALRFFRDTYMKSTCEGEALVKEYYSIAPGIVEKIEARADKNVIYEEIYETVRDCVQLIEQEKWEETKKKYVAMVTRLKRTLE